MANEIIKRRAVRLRRTGNTYSQIQGKLGYISKGTLNNWLSNLELSEKSKEKLQRTQSAHLEKARKIAFTKIAEKREELLNRIKDEVAPLKSKVNDNKTLKIALAFLYLGEGSKWKSHRGLQLGSSDPLLLSLYIKLLKQCYGIDKLSLQCYISYRAES